jgi:hypothetical protein
MKKILLSLCVAISFIACNSAKKATHIDRNANTQNPIMPIIYNGNDNYSETYHLTDYLPQVKCFDSLVFTTEPNYQVLKAGNGLLTLTGDHSLSILSVIDKTTSIKYDSLPK